MKKFIKNLLREGLNKDKLIKEITNTITEYLENEYDGSNLKNAENEAFIKKLVQNEKVFTKKLDKTDNFYYICHIY